MRTSIVALGALVGLASTQQAIVANNCNQPIYVQSFPYSGGGNPGPLSTVEPGHTYSEQFRLPGSTIKIDNEKTLDGPLFFGYNEHDGNVYYEFSDAWGNPFVQDHNILSAGEGCYVFDCLPHAEGCYSKDGSNVPHCPGTPSVTATICA
ncbi:16 kDa allergen [Aspergillus egyptiacus]|nr:16 kDa allergen [Aspergillus egyptiacus]